MKLVLEQITKRVGPEVHIHPTSMVLEPAAVTVLLGATLAGKTSLMRLMAGLDKPSEGDVTVDGTRVTGVAVRDRNVSMVYQQFINYPSLTVFDNIASPLKLKKASGIESRVKSLAAKLHIDHLLDRLPSELSGGQQQRVALARALAKEAPLMLLDEPLVNLDYKLREELRVELTALFASGQSTVVYATTEPTEALLIGGYTAVMDEGRILQYGRTADVFHRPASIRVARAFSDPPMNLLAATPAAGGVTLRDGTLIAMESADAGAGEVTAGFRANNLRVHEQPGDVTLAGAVELAEISGSDTYVHAVTPAGEVVAQLTGVHNFALGQTLPLFLAPDDVYLFDAAGALVRTPRYAATLH